jgi:hypothetical protein
MRHDLEEKHPEVCKKDLTNGQIEECAKTALKKLKRVKAEALALRERYLQERAEFYGIMHHTSAEKAIRGILSAETTKRKFQTIKSGLKGEQSQGLDRVQVRNENAKLTGRGESQLGDHKRRRTRCSSSRQPRQVPRTLDHTIWSQRQVAGYRVGLHQPFSARHPQRNLQFSSGGTHIRTKGMD